MYFRKVFIALVAISFLCTAAFGGEQPEFDAVGCDACNYFNDQVKQLVIDNNINFDGRKINKYSDFTDELVYPLEQRELFFQTAGQEKEDPCFPGYFSHLVDAANSAEFVWKIKLQKKPDTDLDINIRDCVLKMNSFVAFGDEAYAGVSQTGRYIMPWGQVFWVPSANPRITAIAFPGPYATYGFPEYGFFLDARTTPGLYPILLKEACYTSKGIWEESIVVAMPDTGVCNNYGQAQYRLKQGDLIKIIVTVPGNNTVNLNYGADNVVIKYVGIHGTEFLDDILCN